jgi:hypothetical protein
MLCLTEADGCAVQSAPVCRDRASGRRISLGCRRGRILDRAIATRGISCKRVFTGRSGRLTVSTHCWQRRRNRATSCGWGRVSPHSIRRVRFRATRWLPWVGCLSIGAFGATFLLQGISQLLHIDWLTYLAFQILGQQLETWSVDVFLVWCSATVLLMSHGKVKLFGICVMALAVSAEIYGHGVRYFGSGAGGVSPLLKLVLLLPFVWLLLESSKKIPLPEGARKA